MHKAHVQHAQAVDTKNLEQIIQVNLLWNVCKISLGTRPQRLLNDEGSKGLGIWIDSFCGVNNFPAGFEPTSSPQRISTCSLCTRDHSLSSCWYLVWQVQILVNSTWTIFSNASIHGRKRAELNMLFIDSLVLEQRSHSEARWRVQIRSLGVAPQSSSFKNPFFVFGSSRGLGCSYEIKYFAEVSYRNHLGQCHDMAPTLQSEPLHHVCWQKPLPDRLGEVVFVFLIKNH